MANTIIVGGQHGDEGKGKIIDFLLKILSFEVNVRYQGGDNAGHTVVDEEGNKYALHLIPSGILDPSIINGLMNKVAFKPQRFLEEVYGLRERGVEVSPENLFVSDRALLNLPSYPFLDGAAGGKIGTTKRGIG